MTAVTAYTCGHSQIAYSQLVYICSDCEGIHAAMTKPKAFTQAVRASDTELYIMSTGYLVEQSHLLFLRHPLT